MSFTDQKRQVATAEDTVRNWGCAKNGERFRCYLCGHKFAEGDGWRWVYMGDSGMTYDLDGKRLGVINFMVCDACDGLDVRERWLERNKEFASPKFWAIR